MSETRKDPLAIGLGALACGVGFGGATITLAQLLVKVFQARVDPARYREIAADPLVGGLLAGLAAAALFGARRSLPLDNLWQSGVIGVLAVVGALLVGFVAAVADRFLGFAGLVVWGALSVTVGIAGSRWATTGAAGEGPGTEGRS